MSAGTRHRTSRTPRRRARALAGHIAPLLPRGAVVLAVGSGDALDHSILDLRPDIIFTTLTPRSRSGAPASSFDGLTLPQDSASVDAVLLVDVLHYAEEPVRLLAEAARVARQTIVIKDVIQGGWFDRQTLRLMHWLANMPHGAASPGNYWSAREWTLALQRIGAAIESWNTELGLYPWPASVLFDRSLHFVARVGAGPSLRRT